MEYVLFFITVWKNRIAYILMVNAYNELWDKKIINYINKYYIILLLFFLYINI